MQELKHQCPLSYILNDIRLGDCFFGQSECYAPWGFENQASKGAIFHFVIQGKAQVVLKNETLEISQGDFILIPHGEGHLLQSESKVKHTKLEELDVLEIGKNAYKIQIGKEGEKTEFICGGLNFEPSWHPFIKALPSFLLLKKEELEFSKSIIELIKEEVNLSKAGSSAIINRLFEVLILNTLRDWLYNKEKDFEGLKLALHDEYLSKTISKIHQQPNHSWTLENLAKEASMSRTSFSEKFSKTIGISPIQYLTNLRMNLAKDKLELENSAIIDVAQEVGYNSLVSFSRAYKNFWGIPPGESKNIFKG